MTSRQRIAARPPRLATSQARKFNIAVMALALVTLVAGALIVPDTGNYMALVAVALVAMVALAASSFHDFDPVQCFCLVGLCAAPQVVSMVVNPFAAQDLVQILAFTAFAISFYTIGIDLRAGEFERAVKVGLWISTIVAVAVALMSRWDFIGAIRTNIRMDVVFQVNYFGLIFLSLFLMCLALPLSPLTLAISLFCFVAAWSVSSRGAMLAMFAAFLARMLPIALRRLRGRLGIFAPLAALALAFVVVLNVLHPEFAYGVVNSLFQLDNQYRGISAGASGRTEIWQYYYQQWLAHPLFGAGKTLPYIGQKGGALYAHNMFLQILWSSGLVGLVGFAGFLALVIAIGLRSTAEPDLRRALLPVLVGYLAYGIFEGRAVSIGNPLSCLFFWVCFMALGNASTASRNAAGGQRTQQARISDAGRSSANQMRI